jgi:hypothetical protein
VKAFKGRDPIRSKIVIHNKIIEEVNTFNCLGNLVSYEKEKDIDNKITVNTFNCLGNLVSYEKEKDIDNKITKLLEITGIINNTFKTK